MQQKIVRPMDFRPCPAFESRHRKPVLKPWNRKKKKEDPHCKPNPRNWLRLNQVPVSNPRNRSKRDDRSHRHRHRPPPDPLSPRPPSSTCSSSLTRSTRSSERLFVVSICWEPPSGRSFRRYVTLFPVDIFNNFITTDPKKISYDYQPISFFNSHLSRSAV